MKQTSTIDFKAIMSKPMSVMGVPKVKTLTPEHIRMLVRNNHPASHKTAQAKPAFVK